MKHTWGEVAWGVCVCSGMDFGLYEAFPVGYIFFIYQLLAQLIF